MLDEARDEITSNVAEEPQEATEINENDGGEVNQNNEKVLPKIGDEIRESALEDEIEEIEKEVVAIENSDKEIEKSLVEIETSDSIPRENEKNNEV